MTSILIINGPNLNMLGVREPSLYGAESLDDINQHITNYCAQKKIAVTTFQSNSESELISQIHQAHTDKIQFIIINPAAFTHSSVALRDALLAVNIPFIEVHLSNIYKREAFRQQSYFSDVAVGVISGLGSIGYQLAIDAAEQYLAKNAK